MYISSSERKKIHAPGKRIMIVMNLEIHNMLVFQNFSINFSYPKKIVGSCIENEHLKQHPNFRYRKVNIVMGANASGKTSLGRIIMNAVDFIETKRFEILTDSVNDTSKEATLSMDFVGSGEFMYNMKVKISPASSGRYTSDMVKLCVTMVRINSRDSYEICKDRLSEIEKPYSNDFSVELAEIEQLNCRFQHPADTNGEYRFHKSQNSKQYSLIIENVLKAIDPAIDKVEPLKKVENSYVIRKGNRSFVLKDGELTNKALLSSGTKSGIAVADMIYAIKNDGRGLYYCDGIFSYIHSDIEKASVSVMIDSLKENSQLFLTSHNMDLLDFPLPKHSFMFLKKDLNSKDIPVKCVSASDYLKKNTDSVRRAAENDLFSVSPSTDLIHKLNEI